MTAEPDEPDANAIRPSHVEGWELARGDTSRSASTSPIGLTATRRIVFVGRTGSGKTTLAREVAHVLGRPHIELDSLHFRDDLSTVPLEVLRDRTLAAVSGDCWVVDGNKSSVRDLVWPRADTIVWLDYPLAVSLWRLGRRAIARTSRVTMGSKHSSGPARSPGKESTASETERWRILKHLVAAGRGVLRALRSHAGQRRTYPILFASPEYEHLDVIRLRTPRATRRWMETVQGSDSRPPAQHPAD